MTNSKRVLLAGVAILAAVAVVLVVRVASYTPAADIVPSAGPLGYPWRGAIHVHSIASDGAGTLDEIMAAAAAADLDFVIVTEHNPLGTPRARTAWYDDVLLIVGEEISTDDGHLLAFQVAPHRFRFGPTGRQAFDDIAAARGWSLVAHPDHAGQAWTGGWSGVDGLEIVNLAAAWSRQRDLPGAVAVASALIDSDYAAAALLRETWPGLELWDALTSTADGARPGIRRRRVAVGAVDAHGPAVGAFPGYEPTFGVLNTLVWIDDDPAVARRRPAESVEAQLLGSLRAGRAAVETTAVGDAREFTFGAVSGSSKAHMGEFADWELGPWTLEASLAPQDHARFVLLRDGRQIAEASGAGVSAEADQPGTYRVEVYRRDAGVDGVPWLVSNPVYVWPSTLRIAADVRRAPPLPAPPIVTDLLASAEFVTNERGAVSNVVEATADGLQWRFKLPTDASVDDFVALVWRPSPPIDLSGSEGLVIAVAAGEALRLNLEVRTTAADGTPQTWVSSVKASPEANGLGIPWRRFGLRGENDPRFNDDIASRPPSVAELGRVEGVFLVVTPALLEPGASAAVGLRRLGSYGDGRDH